MSRESSVTVFAGASGVNTEAPRNGPPKVWPGTPSGRSKTRACRPAGRPGTTITGTAELVAAIDAHRELVAGETLSLELTTVTDEAATAPIISVRKASVDA